LSQCVTDVGIRLCATSRNVRKTHSKTGAAAARAFDVSFARVEQEKQKWGDVDPNGGDRNSCVL